MKLIDHDEVLRFIEQAMELGDNQFNKAMNEDMRKKLTALVKAMSNKDGDLNTYVMQYWYDVFTKYHRLVEKIERKYEIS